MNQAISQKYDGIILSQGRDPYSTALVKKAVDAGIKVAVFDTAVNGEIPWRDRYPAGRCLTDQPLLLASWRKISTARPISSSCGWRASRRWSAVRRPTKKLQKQYPEIKELESIGAVSSDVQGDTANKVGAILAKYPKGKIDAIWGHLGCLQPGRL